LNARRFRSRTAAGVAAALLVCACARDTSRGPAETAEYVSQQIASGHPAVLWETLPPSHRADVTGLLRDLAAAVDAELWDRSFALLAKLTRLLREKRDFILAHPLLADRVAAASPEQSRSWEALVEALHVTATSELSSVEKLATLDVEAFLEGTGRRVFGLLQEASAISDDETVGDYEREIDALEQLRATVVSQDEDTATLRIEQPGEEPQIQAWVHVEGHWIPATLAAEWPARMARAREAIAGFERTRAGADREKMLGSLATLDAGLDSLLAAQTQEAFDTGAAMLFVMTLGSLANDG
jgi:hypothetical protein